MDGTIALLIALFTPLLSAVIIAFGCRQRPKVAMGLSLLAAVTIFAFSLIATLHYTETGLISASVEWLRLGDFVVSMGFLLDNTAATMLLMVGFVGLLIHVFSVG